MTLIGVPLIALALIATAAAIAATTLLWSRPGRWRPVHRSAGVLLCEVLVVLSAGLIANRQEEFYPSWQALAGDTGTTATTRPRPVGRLDTEFGAGTLKAAWRPAGSAAWQLASNAEVTVPASYPTSEGSFPALVALGGRPAPDGLVRLSLLPTRRTSAAALADLPALLGTDLRVTGHGWALLTAPAWAGLAARFVAEHPGRFTALAVVGAPPPGFHCPPGVAVAVARPASEHGALPRGAAVARPGSGRGALPRGAAQLTGSWAAASGWAARQTPPTLAAPEVLPTAAVA